MNRSRTLTLLAAATVPLVLATGCGGAGVARAESRPAAPSASPSPDETVAPEAPAGSADDVPVTAEGSLSPRPPVRRPYLGARARWVPAQGLSWQVQYAGAVAAGEPAQVIDVDGVETSAEQVAAWHAQGKKVVCYLNAGAFEDWRPDAAQFPAGVRGKALDGWPGERWLDVRRRDVLVPIMTRRIEECAQKGFDAVDPDNVDGSRNDTGFPLTDADSAAYVRELAAVAHRRGLSVSLKNATELLPQLTADVDFAVNEQCREFDECDAYADFTASGKAVVNLEYSGAPAEVCAAVPRGFTRLLKHENLDAWTVRC